MSFLIYDLSFLAVFVIFVASFLYSKRKNLKKEGLLFLYKTTWGLKLINRVGTKYKKALKKIITLGVQQPQLAQQPQMQQQPAQMQQPQFVQQPVQQMQPGRPVQVVSGYAPQKKTGKTLIIVLVVVLVLLVGFLATIFIFRDKLADILGGLI